MPSTGYQLSKIRSLETNLVSTALLDQINKKIRFEIEIEIEKKNCLFFSIFRSVKSPASVKENGRFLDSLDFENFPDFQTGRNVR